jgi:hypothetical protein
VFDMPSGRGRQESGAGADLREVTTVLRKSESVVPVTQQALDKVRAVLRAVAAGEPVDNASAAAAAAYALAALPPSPRQEQLIA